ncbi:MAG: 3'-5' exonuclease [Gallionellaceae bacterium]|jgi:DNA polymerase III alpha subunit (gram-positive type)
MYQQGSIDSLPESFIVFDLETTGLDATQNEIIEIAAIRFKKGSTAHETMHALVKPKAAVPSKISKLTGITQEMLDRDGEPIRDVLEDFRGFFGDLRLVSFDSESDMAFLQTAAENNGLPPFRNPTTCALKLAQQAWPNSKSYRLEDITSGEQFNNSGAPNRALEGARRVLIVYAAASDIINAAYSPQVNVQPTYKHNTSQKIQRSKEKSIGAGILAAFLVYINKIRE